MTINTTGTLVLKCCKCGWGACSVVYKPHQSVYDQAYTKDNEHLKVTCLRCGYSWKELPLDKQKDVHND